MPRTEIRTGQDLGPLLRRLAKFRTVTLDEAKNIMTVSVGLVEGAVTKRTPVDTGALRSSIYGEVVENGSEIEGRVGTPLPYGAPVEFGTGAQAIPSRTRKAPPASALYRWVERVLNIHDEREVKSVAFLIARAIRRRGTKPRRMFRLGWASVRGKVRKLFAQGLKGNYPKR